MTHQNICKYMYTANNCHKYLHYFEIFGVTSVPSSEHTFPSLKK